MLKKVFPLFCLVNLLVYNPIAFSQDGECGTIEPPDFFKQLSPATVNPPLNNATVQVFIHIIRKKNGNGGASLSEVINVYNYVLPAYQVHGICFNLIGIDYIDNNDFAKRYEKSGCSDCSFDKLIQTNAHSNAIDIYIVPKYHSSASEKPRGKASGIPGKALVLVKEGDGLTHASVMAHELGHCLGLYHTHHGTLTETVTPPDPDQCAELVNGTNCSITVNPVPCGDYVCETPADPSLILNNNYIVDESCNYTGTAIDANLQPYTPNTNNIMSYSRLTCRTYFFGEQGLRIRDMIANSPLLQATLAPANITLQNLTVPFNPPWPSPTITDLTITASNSIIAGPNVTVNPTGKLNLVAENKVILLPGFKAEFGSHFCAQIGPSCFPVPNCKIIPYLIFLSDNNLSAQSDSVALSPQSSFIYGGHFAPQLSVYLVDNNKYTPTAFAGSAGFDFYKRICNKFYLKTEVLYAFQKGQPIPYTLKQGNDISRLIGYEKWSLIKIPLTANYFFKEESKIVLYPSIGVQQVFHLKSFHNYQYPPYNTDDYYSIINIYSLIGFGCIYNVSQRINFFSEVRIEQNITNIGPISKDIRYRNPKENNMVAGVAFGVLFNSLNTKK